ncbi:hypothetical protein JQX13_44120 [Archangium violaceum]|uniref:hypothetical protein n=1 Tax=Archangium violaceum TaxID=83451 RepID=UPI00193BF4FC|nr:hypothetical protein [Archangium violaceum]QRK06978.1 hypothetical protein JQX13_44120 [Archangium violaceum]
MAKLVCTIEMDKTNGITVKVEDPQGQITQVMTMDSQSITIKMQNQSNTSTIVQKADSITVTVQDFTVNADTITLTSTKDSKWTSQQKLTLESTQDMTLTSSAKLTQSATQDAKLSSTANVNVEATSNITLKGMQATLQATAGEAKVDGVMLKLNGQAQAEMAAPLATVSAQGKLSLESTGLADLKGTMTNVGGIVKLG